MHISWLVSVIKMKYYFFLWSSWLLTHMHLPLSFSIIISMVTWYIGDAVSNYTFSRLYNNNNSH
jgi:hypothetical protein